MVFLALYSVSGLITCEDCIVNTLIIEELIVGERLNYYLSGDYPSYNLRS
jgi:hypothetical protein